jgi:hypothetical protein
VGWNISLKVMLMPLAMAAMFFNTGIHIKYTESGKTGADPARRLVRRFM